MILILQNVLNWFVERDKQLFGIQQKSDTYLPVGKQYEKVEYPRRFCHVFQDDDNTYFEVYFIKTFA